ncbi:MAG: TerB family tellurite resistance protein [Pseudomonadota bacterium]
MFRRLQTLIDRLEGPEPVSEEDRAADLRLAAAALLVEQARMDETIDDSEHDRIVELVRWRFKLGEEEAAELVQSAEGLTSGPAQWYGLTAKIKNAFNQDERIQMIEMLWDVAYADGKLDDMEANLIRRIAGLLYVDDRDSGRAHKRVLQRYGVETDTPS